MSEPSPAPDTGVLSVDAAAALLSAERKNKAPEAEPADPDMGAEEPEASAEDAPVGGEEQAADPEAAPPEEEETPADEPEPPAIDPPVSWDAEAKADFAQLPRALQEKVAAREQQRETAIGAAQQRAASAEKIAGHVTQLGQALEPILQHAQHVFKGKWDGKDWAKLRAEDPLGYIQEHGEYEEELTTLRQLQAARQEAAAQEVNLFLTKREEELPQFAPELCGPEGAAKRTALSQFLLNAGIPADAISKGATAAMLGIAFDAMRYRALQAEATATVRQPTPGAAGASPRTPAPVPASRPVRPSTAPAQGDSRTRARDQAFERLSQTGDFDDGLAALRAQRKARR